MRTTLAASLLTLLAGTAAMALPHRAQAQPLVSAAWLAGELGKPDVVVLDIRPAAVYAAGHIPGAVAADYEKSGWRAALPDGSGGALPPIAQISALISRLGVGDASHAVIVGEDFGAMARVYWTLKVLGHEDVSLLDGGWSAWRANPADTVSTASVSVQPATFTPHFNPALRAELPEVQQAVASGDETLLDARPPAQWLGKEKTPVVKEYGHLPGAVWVDQGRALVTAAQLKPKEQLEQEFSSVAQGKDVISYCNTGHLAATDWFVLSEVLHKKNTKLYDASMSQWTADASRPVVREATTQQ